MNICDTVVLSSIFKLLYNLGMFAYRYMYVSCGINFHKRPSSQIISGLHPGISKTFESSEVMEANPKVP
jgi:hypothetical protein